MSKDLLQIAISRVEICPQKILTSALNNGSLQLGRHVLRCLLQLVETSPQKVMSLKILIAAGDESWPSPRWKLRHRNSFFENSLQKPLSLEMSSAVGDESWLSQRWRRPRTSFLLQREINQGIPRCWNLCPRKPLKLSSEVDGESWQYPRCKLRSWKPSLWRCRLRKSWR